jgi:hypothetical protein
VHVETNYLGISIRCARRNQLFRNIHSVCTLKPIISEYPFGVHVETNYFGISIQCARRDQLFRNTHSVCMLKPIISEYPFGVHVETNYFGIPIRWALWNQLFWNIHSVCMLQPIISEYPFGVHVETNYFGISIRCACWNQLFLCAWVISYKESNFNSKMYSFLLWSVRLHTAFVVPVARMVLQHRCVQFHCHEVGTDEMMFDDGCLLGFCAV